MITAVSHLIKSDIKTPAHAGVGVGRMHREFGRYCLIHVCRFVNKQSDLSQASQTGQQFTTVVRNTRARRRQWAEIGDAQTLTH